MRHNNWGGKRRLIYKQLTTNSFALSTLFQSSSCSFKKKCNILQPLEASWMMKCNFLTINSLQNSALRVWCHDHRLNSESFMQSDSHGGFADSWMTQSGDSDATDRHVYVSHEDVHFSGVRTKMACNLFMSPICLWSSVAFCESSSVWTKSRGLVFSTTSYAVSFNIWYSKKKKKWQMHVSRIHVWYSPPQSLACHSHRGRAFAYK